MDQLVQLNNQAGGRDKIARLIQYASRAMWDSLESANSNPALVDNFKTVEYILSTFRKCRYSKEFHEHVANLISTQYSALASALMYSTAH